MPASRESREFNRVRQAVLLGLFAGTGVGLGFLLFSIPGLELMTLNAALAGVALGPVLGALAGGLAMGVFSLAHPLGAPVPLLLAAQVLGMALAGWLGGGLAPVLRRVPWRIAVGLAAMIGLVASLALDLLTNLAAAVAFGLPSREMLKLAVPVVALHVGTNAVAFALVLPTLAVRLARLRNPGPRVVSSLLVMLVVGLGSTAAAQPASADSTSTEESAAMAPATAPADSLFGPDPFAPPGPEALAAADSLARVEADSASAESDSLTRRRADANRVSFDAASRADRFVRDWNRPLWDPFFVSLRENLQRRTYWLPIQDGGQGSAVIIMGEPSTSVAPRIVRESIPLGIGHRYIDDPEAVAIVGQTMLANNYGLGSSGGLAGDVELMPYDPVPDRDLADTRWSSGRHESYLRDVHLLTADAPWRLGFDFEEILDNEGYDFRVPGDDRYGELDNPESFRGHTKFRSGRGFVRRDLGAAGIVAMSIENVRKLKDAMPAYGIEHQDLWLSHAAVDWRGLAADAPIRVALWWLDTDVDWDRDEPSYRKQEGAHSGVLAAWGDPDQHGRLDVTWGRWTVVDSGADAEWAGPDPASGRWQGELANMRGSRAWNLGGARTAIELGVWWDEYGGWLVGGAAEVTESRDRPRWSLRLERGGRAPRSDELVTDWRFVVPDGRQTVALAERGLDRENEWRLAAGVSPRLAGFELALEGAMRRLRDGIGWQPLDGQTYVGRWQNGLELDSATIRAAISREGRFLGWIRARAQGTYRHWNEAGDLQFSRPPESDWQISVLWENHFFSEDGILQLAGFVHNRGAMDDPWFLAEPIPLDSYVRVDAIVGFRLVGTNLSAEFINLTSTRHQYSAGALSDSMDLRWRLNWVFHF